MAIVLSSSGIGAIYHEIGSALVRWLELVACVCVRGWGAAASGPN